MWTHGGVTGVSRDAFHPAAIPHQAPNPSAIPGGARSCPLRGLAPMWTHETVTDT